MCLSGFGSYTIAKELNQKNIPGPRNSKWVPRTIAKMLQNEKYIGDVLYQKTYTDSNFKIHINHGEMDKVYLEEHHEPIIPRSTFDLVQEMIKERREKRKNTGGSKYQNRYVFSGKVECGECGGKYRRRKQYSYIAWACENHITGNCKLKYIREDQLKTAFVRMMGKLEYGKKKMLEPLVTALNAGRSKEMLVRIAEIEDELEKNAEHKKMVLRLSAGGYLEPGVFNQQIQELKAENNRLKNEKERLKKNIGDYETGAGEVEKLMKYHAPDTFEKEAFNEFVQRIVVISRREVEFHLRCGLKLREKINS